MKRNINRNQSHPNIIKCQASSFLKGGHQNENLVEKEAKHGEIIALESTEILQNIFPPEFEISHFLG